MISRYPSARNTYHSWNDWLIVTPTPRASACHTTVRLIDQCSSMEVKKPRSVKSGSTGRPWARAVGWVRAAWMGSLGRAGCSRERKSEEDLLPSRSRVADPGGTPRRSDPRVSPGRFCDASSYPRMSRGGGHPAFGVPGDGAERCRPGRHRIRGNVERGGGGAGDTRGWLGGGESRSRSPRVSRGGWGHPPRLSAGTSRRGTPHGYPGESRGVAGPPRMRRARCRR